MKSTLGRFSFIDIFLTDFLKMLFNISVIFRGHDRIKMMNFSVKILKLLVFKSFFKNISLSFLERMEKDSEKPKKKDGDKDRKRDRNRDKGVKKDVEKVVKEVLTGPTENERPNKPKPKEGLVSLELIICISVLLTNFWNLFQNLESKIKVMLDHPT
jgi:hypothetical protein